MVLVQVKLKLLFLNIMLIKGDMPSKLKQNIHCIKALVINKKDLVEQYRD
jgi:hypothetical protein